MSTAARQLTQMGLHRSGVHDIVANHAGDHRMLFVVSFYFEKWACLCHGAPTTLIWGSEAGEIANGLPKVSRKPLASFTALPLSQKPSPPLHSQISGMDHLIQLGRLMDDVQTFFESMASSDKQTTLSRALKLHHRLMQFRSALEGDYDAFEQMGSKLANHLRDRSAQAIFVQITVYGLYLQLRMLVSLPMLEQVTWETLQQQTTGLSPDSGSPDLGDLSTDCEQMAALTVSLKHGLPRRLEFTSNCV
jgi:hypothetical protein